MIRHNGKLFWNHGTCIPGAEAGKPYHRPEGEPGRVMAEPPTEALGGGALIFGYLYEKGGAPSGVNLLRPCQPPPMKGR